MADSSLFMEEVRKIARCQADVETARKKRFEMLTNDNFQLQEENKRLRKMLQEYLERDSKRSVIVDKFRRADEPVQMRDSSSPAKATKEEEKRIENRGEDKPAREPPQLAVEQQHNTVKTSADLAAQARANTMSRSKVTNPCRFARSGVCKFGDKCRYSHNILPDSYCPVYNASATCDTVGCALKHELYRYIPTLCPSAST